MVRVAPHSGSIRHAEGDKLEDPNAQNTPRFRLLSFYTILCTFLPLDAVLQHHIVVRITVATKLCYIGVNSGPLCMFGSSLYFPRTLEKHITVISIQGITFFIHM